MEIYYGREGQELLNESIKDVVKNYVYGCTVDEIDSMFPVDVYEFKQANPFVKDFAMNMLEDILEDLDGEYGDPDSNGTIPTERMIEASKQFVEVLKEEYDVWLCEKTGVKHTITKEKAIEMGVSL